MSTELKSSNADINLTRFFGGKDRGVCVQITTGWQEHIQLTRQQALRLSKDLEAFANKEEVPDYAS